MNNFLTRVYLTAPLRGYPLAFCNGVEVRKLE